MNKPLLQVEELKTYFMTSEGLVRAVDGANFEVAKGETIGLVGESGCGKSTVALSIMRLIRSPPGKIVGGRILFNGDNILTKTEAEIRRIRGEKIAMSFQDPMTFFNPVMRCGDQIVESIVRHRKTGKNIAMERAVEVLSLVGIPSPSKVVMSYPHQLSGGMRQRAMIAMALSCEPELLIADEPTTALDVIVQAQLLQLIKDLKQKLTMSMIVITHDLGVVSELSDKIAVMYAGKIVEYSDKRTILKEPAHPYTSALMESIPRLSRGKARLKSIEGIVPDLISKPKGCAFCPRCSRASNTCRTEEPTCEEFSPGHVVACYHPIESQRSN